MEKKLTQDEIEFLKHSNYIEREYSKKGFEDAKKAWLYALEKKEFVSLKYVLEIHKILMQRLSPEIGGKVRECEVWVGIDKYPKIPKEELESKIENWIGDYFKKVTTIEEVIKSHIEFEKMHPFTDGNGRTGRILMNIQMLNKGYPLLIIHEGKEQREYYKLFNK